MRLALWLLLVSGGTLLPSATSEAAGSDLRLYADSVKPAPDTAGQQVQSPGFHSTKSPWLAVGLSAALPGAGQIYDESYWKVPVIWALGIYWIYEWRQLNTQYQDFRSRYSESLVSLPPAGNPQLLLNRNFYRDERDKFAWFLGGLYLLNLVDAYVGAHLYDFNVSPDLSADGRFVPRVTATVRFSF